MHQEYSHSLCGLPEKNLVCWSLGQVMKVCSNTRKSFAQHPLVLSSKASLIILLHLLILNLPSGNIARCSLLSLETCKKWFSIHIFDASFKSADIPEDTYFLG